jgi:biofilm PGA synthesis N-glycosyltransferase PgaC
MDSLVRVGVDDRTLIRSIIHRAPQNERRVIVLIPARNEAASIAATIHSVRTQSVAPTVIVVAANNCSDDTEEVARSSGALVFLAEPNKDKKAGALNLALEYIMEVLTDDDGILVMDADTTLSHNFIETAKTRLNGDVGGVGGAFIGRESTSVIGTCQRMEYHRYRKEIIRNGQRAFVLSGTGTLFSAHALRTVKASRDGKILPKGDSYYDTISLTEDNEMTLAMLACGFQCVSPADMTTTTDVMDTVSALWNQRDRWSLGALWNLRAYGFKMPWHMKYVYWRQQIGLAISVFSFFLYVTLMSVSIAIGGLNLWSPFWLTLTLIVITERAYSVWSMGWKARIFAILPVEQMYSILLCLIFLVALLKCIAGNRGNWIPT